MAPGMGHPGRPPETKPQMPLTLDVMVSSVVPPASEASRFRPLVERLRAGFATGLTRDLDWRRDQLNALHQMLIEHEADLAGALAADLGKSPSEARMTELSITTAEIEHLAENLEAWFTPRRVSTPLFAKPATAEVIREPLGLVLVISPWNYPVQLTLAPLAGAIAAGNAVIVKPSEISTHTEEVLTELLPQYLDPQVFGLVTGGPDETGELLRERFDHIFFTGNPAVGRVVMRAAAEHLTPVTLELGGKSPAFVDATCDLTVAARRIAWGKFLNAGQTCVAPDHVLVTPEARDQLVENLGKAITEFYGKDPSRSGDFGRIITQRHFDRIAGMLDQGTIVHGGRTDRDDRYIAPTVITDPDPDSALMTEEIFGPILPVVTVADTEAALAHINEREKPLALYVFSDDSETCAAFRERTSSGGLTYGIPVLHLSVPDLPFGGVGNSGMGSYHGEASIRTFSHERSVMRKPAQPDSMAAVYPPVRKVKQGLLKILQPMRKK